MQRFAYFQGGRTDKQMSTRLEGHELINYLERAYWTYRESLTAWRARSRQCLHWQETTKLNK